MLLSQLQAMLTVAVISQKGGVGKSTLAVNLAGEYARGEGDKALIIDLDTQGSALEWVRRRGDELPPDVMPGHPRTLDQEIERAEGEGYGLCVIDTQPRSEQTSLLAARAADLILVPVRPGVFDLASLATTLDLCKIARKPFSVILSAAPIRSRIVEEAKQVITDAEGEVCPVIITHRAAYSHALIGGQTAAEYDPGCPAAQEIERLLKHVVTWHHSTLMPRQEQKEKKLAGQKVTNRSASRSPT